MTATTEILIPKAVIEKRVAELAARISADYAGKEPLVVGVLNGAFVFMADLIRALAIPCGIDFVRVASYGAGAVTTGEIRILKDLEKPVAGRDLLVVEDIVDTGLTLARLTERLGERAPASIRVCVLLDKRERRRVPFEADYVGFAIPDVFVVGYGLDYNERYRSLPDVRVVRGIV